MSLSGTPPSTAGATTNLDRVVDAHVHLWDPARKDYRLRRLVSRSTTSRACPAVA